MSSSTLWKIRSRRTRMVSAKLVGEKCMAHKERRVGQSAYHGDPSTSDLQSHESCFCRGSSLFAIFPWFFGLSNLNECSS